MNAAPGRIPTRHPHRLRLPCIVQVTVRHTTVTRAESARGTRLHPPWTTIEAVDPRGMTRRRSDASVVAVAHGHPRCAPTDGPDPATGTGIATATATAIEKGRANIPEETDRDQDHAADPARGTEDGVAVVIAAKTGTGTKKAAGITLERRHTNRMLWRITEKRREWRRIRRRLLPRSQMLSRMMVASWRCSRRCKSKCSPPCKNPPLRCWRRNM